MSSSGLGRPKKRERKFLTFRLLEEDRQLLQDLGRVGEEDKDRYHALCELTDIVPELDIPVAEKAERRALRLGIPEDLDVKIREVADRTKQPYLFILLEAAKEYRRRFPHSPGTTRETNSVNIDK